MKKRYTTSCMLEWRHVVAPSLTAEYVIYNRVQLYEEHGVEFLHKFESFDDFVVDVVVHEIALVSFRGLVSLLTKDRGLSKTFRQSWVDYPSEMSVSWAIVRPGSSEFILPGGRSNALWAAIGRSLLDVVVPDSVLHSASSWKMAVSGGEFRKSVWALRNILDVIAGRLHRNYSLKAGAEDELDTARGEIEALNATNADLLEENGELRRRIVANPLVKRRRAMMASIVASICEFRFSSYGMYLARSSALLGCVVLYGNSWVRDYANQRMNVGILVYCRKS